jgi:hypothetical protein
MKCFALFIPFLTLFFACKQEETELQDTTNKIVLNGLISSDNLLNVRICRSASIYDNSLASDTSLNTLPDAQVCIYQNDYIDTLYYVHKSSYDEQNVFSNGNYWSKCIFPLPGKDYKIVVKAPGLPDATAFTTIPNIVRIERIDTSRIILLDSLSGYKPSNVCLICNIEFTDPGNEPNYYLFNVWKIPGNGAYDMGFDSQDPIIEVKIPCIGSSRLEGIAFTDKIINGQKYDLTVKIYGANIGKPFWNGDSPDNHKKAIYFKLSSITEECFKYIQTLRLYNQEYGNPLTNPVILYSNINGGYGIFTGAAVSEDSVVFHY